MKEYFFDEKKIYYRMNEFREGRPTLVFVHGLSGSSSAWHEYEKKFEHTYNILSPDLRGHGRSHKPRRYADYEIRHFVDDISTLVRHLHLPPFILVSHSFGTLITLEFLALHQQMVVSAVFLSPNVSIRKRFIARIFEPLFGMLALIMDIFPVSSAPGRHIDYSYYKNTGDWNIRRMIADVGNTGLRIYLYATKHSYAIDRQKFLADITIPVLIIHGKNDTIFPVEYGMQMAKNIKKSKLILLEDADHIIALNNVNEVASAIEDFVKETVI